MSVLTTNYGLIKPDVNSATDQDLWGGQLNTNADDLDGLTLTSINWVKSAKTIDFVVASPTAGSTSTGDAKKLFVCDATSGSFSATIPNASAAGDGFVVAFKKTDSTVNAINLVAAGGQTIDGAATYALASQYDWVVIVSDGTSKWHVISKTAPIISPAAIADKTLVGNISGASASPTALTLTQILDNILGNTQGGVIYRGASAWAKLDPGTSGQFLKTQGASANPAWDSLTSTLPAALAVGSSISAVPATVTTYTAGTEVAAASLTPGIVTANPAGNTVTFTATGESISGTWRVMQKIIRAAGSVYTPGQCVRIA